MNTLAPSARRPALAELAARLVLAFFIGLATSITLAGVVLLLADEAEAAEAAEAATPAASTAGECSIRPLVIAGASGLARPLDPDSPSSTVKTTDRANRTDVAIATDVAPWQAIRPGEGLAALLTLTLLFGLLRSVRHVPLALRRA